MVTAGLQSLSSSSNERQTVPDGYTLGWKMGGSNLPAHDREHQNNNHRTNEIIDNEEEPAPLELSVQ